ncbi:hypothetical protein [Vibrio mediterranei]|jgi:hypothetical protein|uniref:Uncharacterized protein n=1 Tax=Vibrio mediterranei TaxID=689 RepID=A0ABX5D8B0_9VIBR|nr:hypothetical protein [Vibrio mediterranei]MCG9656881.1 hypothetical protein [Vibrio mediterranei]MCG9661585.1 hypothetical protein [Vibrio mediterranei]PCD85536.1 hypothetical protein COR52_26015 [Vibrio mediterranei]PRQ64831.1 hypothetical protein COR51_25590 [Vibrio mediterranei]PTC04178.1 hypothetical protein C9980_14635 [Vibrio mediterranei]
MPAQKLTKGRLVQIIIMMVVLIAAFSYRTVTHSDGKVVSCVENRPCAVSVGEKTITFLYQGDSKVLSVTKSKDLTIHVQNIETMLNESSKESTIQGLNLPAEIKVTDRNGESVLVQYQ